MKALIIILAILLLKLSVSAAYSGIEPIVNSYLKLKSAFVNSDPEKIKESAAHFIDVVNLNANIKSDSPDQKNFNKMKSSILKYSSEIYESDKIEAQRKSFARLSVMMWDLLKESENLSRNIYYMYCPMKDSFWLSAESAIKNPYYGASMLNCGNISDKKLK
jgi:hypothetical protein